MDSYIVSTMQKGEDTLPVLLLWIYNDDYAELIAKTYLGKKEVLETVIGLDREDITKLIEVLKKYF